MRPGSSAISGHSLRERSMTFYGEAPSSKRDRVPTKSELLRLNETGKLRQGVCSRFLTEKSDLSMNNVASILICAN